MKTLSSIFNFLAFLFWLGAIGILLWQGWGWLSAGTWTSIPVHVAFTKLFGFTPIGDGFYPVVFIGVIMQQSLALILALAGALCNGMGKIFDR
jgi:hypothetical protein